MARIVTDFSEMTASMFENRQISDVEAIPSEFVLMVPRTLIEVQADPLQFNELNSYLTLNYEALEDLTTPAGFPPEIDGTYLDTSGAQYYLRYTSTNEIVVEGPGVWETKTAFNGAQYFDVSTYLSSTVADVSGFPETVEMVFPHTQRINPFFDVFRVWGNNPLYVYALYRPASSVPNTTTVVDQLGLPGAVDMYLLGHHEDTAKSYASFVGIIKRSAIGKAVADLLDSDIIIGGIAVDGRMAFILDGVALFEDVIPSTIRQVEINIYSEFAVFYNETQYNGLDGLRQALVDGLPLSDLHNRIFVNPSITSLGYNPTDNFGDWVYLSVPGSVPSFHQLDLSEAVFAYRNDVAYLETVSSDYASHEGYIQCYPNWDTEMPLMYAYPTPSTIFWTERVRTQEIE